MVTTSIDSPDDTTTSELLTLLASWRRHLVAQRMSPATLSTYAAAVRALVCRDLGHLGIELDPAENDVHAETISAQGSGCLVKVVPTNEDLMIARHTHTLVFGGGAAGAATRTPEGGPS